MIALAVAVIVVLGAFCVVLYFSQERRQRYHDETMAAMVRQITSTNPSNSTLKAMKQTAEVLSDTVDKVTDTIGKSFAVATGVGQSTVVNPVADAEPPDELTFYPDIEFDPLFAPLDTPTPNGMISPQATEPTL